MLPVRTNNDIEGWQHLKQKIRQQGAPSVLPVGGAVTSRVPPGVHPNPTGLRREAVQDPAKEILATPGTCLQTLGRLQLQGDFSSAAVETMQLTQWTSWEIRRCANLFTLIKVYIWFSKGQVWIRHSHVPACNKTIRSTNSFTLIKVDIWFGWNRVVRILSIFISFCQSISDITRDYWQDNVLALCSL